MKILIVTPFLWSGAGKAIVRLAGAFRQLNHDVAVVSSGESKGYCDWPSYVQDLHTNKIPCHRIDFFDRNPEVFWHSVERLKQVVAEFQPDIIHANSGMASFGSIASTTVPVVATLHSWNPGRPAWMNTMDVWALNRCARVVCLSFSYRDYLLDMGLRTDISEVIHLGIDCEPLRELAAGTVKSGLLEKKYFCFLGRLESRKRQMLLVETLGALPEDWSLLLMGTEGEPGYAERVQSRAAELGVSKRLVWTGQLENPFPLLRQSRCFVSASSDEGLGLAALEAMAVGVPVIATPARGITDFLRDNETGCIAQPSPEAISEKILALDSDPSIRSGLISRATALVQSRFSWDKAVRQYLTVFEEESSRPERHGENHDNGNAAKVDQPVLA